MPATKKKMGRSSLGPPNQMSGRLIKILAFPVSDIGENPILAPNSKGCLYAFFSKVSL